MQLAVLLIFLWSGSTGVTAFRMSLPRTTRLSPHLGLFNPTSTTTAVTCSREATGVPHRAYPAPAGGGGRRGGDVVAVGGHRKVIAGSLLGGKNAGSSGGEEVKADGSTAEQETGGSSDSGGKPANLFERLGSAGLVAYGLLNGLWYCSAIAFFMLGPMGKVPAASMEGVIAASVKQLGKVIGLVWLGSQATKPLRLGLAALATPAADKLIVFTQRRLGLPRKKNAATLLMASTLGSTLAFCLAVIALGAARAAVAVSAASHATGPAASSAVLLLLGLRKGGGLGQRFDFDDGFVGIDGGGGGGGGGAFSSLSTRAATVDHHHGSSPHAWRTGRRLRRAGARRQRPAPPSGDSSSSSSSSSSESTLREQDAETQTRRLRRWPGLRLQVATTPDRQKITLLLLLSRRDGGGPR
ncbi:unnamed protein product [Pylaiella littoralis]